MRKVLTEVWPAGSGHSIPPEALHILARRSANADSRRKLKQVLHLVTMRARLDGSGRNKDAVIADLGTGKSYLGFILYDLVIGKWPRRHRASMCKRLMKAHSCRQYHLAAWLRRRRDFQHDAARAAPTCDGATCLRHARRCHPLRASPQGQGDRAHSVLQARLTLLGHSRARSTSCGAIPSSARVRRARHQRAARSGARGAGLQGAGDGFTGPEHSMKNEQSGHATSRAISGQAPARQVVDQMA